MNTENLIAKGVEKHFDGQKVLFNVESLHKHYDGIEIHESDLISIESVDYVKAGDINGENAVCKDVDLTDEEYIKLENEPIKMTYEEAEKLLKEGKLIALPEWGGFWFGNIKTEEILVLTKDGEITNTPFDEFKERKDWIEVEPTPKQKELLDKYFESLEPNVEETILDSDKKEESATDIPKKDYAADFMGMVIESETKAKKTKTTKKE